MINKNETPIRSLLRDDELLPFEILNREGETPLLLICDHSSHRVPACLNKMGLSADELTLHIGYDIGVRNITQIISDRLKAPAVMCNYSRLVIDCNRQPGDPSSIPQICDGIAIPANQGLSEEEEVERSEAVFWPYHHAIIETGAHLWRKGTPPALLSIHSFTPVLMSRSEERPWHISILWKEDPRLALPLIQILNRQDGIVIGDNVPYSGWEDAYSIDLHGAAPGLPYCAIEIRQDLISDKAGQEKWANILSSALLEIFEDRSIFQVKHY